MYAMLFAGGTGWGVGWGLQHWYASICVAMCEYDLWLAMLSDLQNYVGWLMVCDWKLDQSKYGVDYCGNRKGNFKEWMRFQLYWEK